MSSSDSRDRYVEAAARLFADKGFHGTSLAAVAAELGVTKQALLHFFKTKAALYAAVLAALSDRLVALLERTEGATPEARVAAFFERVARQGAERPQDPRLVVRALLDDDGVGEVRPLRPFLEAMIALLRETEAWADASDAEALSAMYLHLGAAQYLAISAETLRSTFGATLWDEMSDRLPAMLHRAVQAMAASRT